jgi:hypothetical protein
MRAGDIWGKIRLYSAGFLPLSAPWADQKNLLLGGLELSGDVPI